MIRYTAIMSTLIVLLVSVSLGEARARDLTLRETTRIGSDDLEGNDIFGRISHVITLRDGSVVVADHQIKQIRKFSEEGEHLFDVGAEGPGPGEYWDARGLLALPDDRIAVLSRPSLINLFDGETGNYLTSFNSSSQLFSFDERLLECDDEGRIYVKSVKDNSNPDEEWTFEWLVLDDTGELVERRDIPRRDPSHEQFVIIFPEGIRSNFAVTTEAAWCRRGYFVVGRSDDYSFEIQDPDSPKVVRREWEAVTLTEEERSEWKRRADRVGERSDGDYEVPATKPAFRGLRVDRYDRIWVHRYVPAVEVTEADEDGTESTVWREPNSYDVFTPAGEIVGTVTLPIGVRAVAWTKDAIWGREEAAVGEQLVRWEVEGLDVPDGGS